MLTLCLLGTPSVLVDDKRVDDQLLVKDLALLFYLAMTGQSQPRTSLAVLLWGDLGDAAARTNLRKSLSALNKNCGDYITIERDRVGLIKERCDVDVWSFERHAQEGITAGNVARLQAAVALYTGDFLTGFAVHNASDFDIWLYHMQERLRGVAVNALSALAAQHEQDGKHAEAATCLRRILLLEPWREEAYRHLMGVLAASGERSAALIQYQACVDNLAQELGVEPGLETRDLYQRIRDNDLPAPFASMSVPGGRPTPSGITKLPAELTAIVGRDRELAEVSELLSMPDCRLVSIIGPGGIGKSRLALALSHRPGQHFDDVGMVLLAGFERAADIPQAIGHAFHLALAGQESVAVALQARTGRLLLVLDNFEPLLPDGAFFIEELLYVAPNVVCLVTTREALSLPCEWRYDLQELPYPVDLDDPHLGEYAAVQLFVQLVRRARPRHALQRVELVQAARICQLVGGMPLGIELAAAQTGRLPLRSVCEQLEAGLDTLEGALRDLPNRQRSLLASFEASWHALAPDERRVLASLSVLNGEFTVDAALSIAEATVVSILRLVDKSMLRLNEADRYSLHEVIRRFAARHLQATPGGTEAAFERYRAYYLSATSGGPHKIYLFVENASDRVRDLQSLVQHLRIIWRHATCPSLADAAAMAVNDIQIVLRNIQLYAAGDSTVFLRDVRTTLHSNRTHLEDVFSVDIVWIPTLAADVADLTDMFLAEHSQLLPVLAEACSVDNRLVAYPTMLQVGLLYYRRDLLEKYRFHGPPRTWDELQAAAAEIQARERAAGHRGFWGYIWQGIPHEHLMCNALEWQYAEGGGSIVETNGTVTVNNPRAIFAMERARRWIGTISPPEIMTLHEGNSAEMWMSGNVAFMRLWADGYQIYADSGARVSDITGITLLPRGAACHAGTLGGWPLAIRQESQDMESAATLIKTIAAPAAQRNQALRSHPHPPALRALYDDPEITARHPVYAELRTLIQCGGLAIRPAKVTGLLYPQVSSAYTAAIAAILYDGAGAAETLAGLEQQLVTLGGWSVPRSK